MLYSLGSARSLAADRCLAASLAFIAGALNTVGLRAVGFFAANMTGNVSSASERLATGDALAAASYLSLIIVFVLGAACSTLWTEFGRRRGVGAAHAWVVAAEASLLCLLGLADIYVPGVHGSSAFVLCLSFLMGLQNATVTRISSARVRTTHVSGMLTDIGIECAELLVPSAARATDDHFVDPVEVRSKLALHLQTVLAFLAGGMVGIVLYTRIEGFFLVLAATSLAGLTIPSIARGKAAALQSAEPEF